MPQERKPSVTRRSAIGWQNFTQHINLTSTLFLNNRFSANDKIIFFMDFRINLCAGCKSL